MGCAVCIVLRIAFVLEARVRDDIWLTGGRSRVWSRASNLELNGAALSRMKSTAIVVLGMHRSGTSALTGALNSLGVRLGNRLYTAQAGVNDRGFWEHADIADMHDSILRVMGSYWDDFLPFTEQQSAHPALPYYNERLKRIVDRDFVRNRLWGVKDPRMCRLLPLWLPLFKEMNVGPVFILIVRHPAEVCKSLHARDGMSIEKALLLWLRYNLEAELYSRNLPRITVTFDSLVKDTRDTLTSIERILNISFPTSVEEALPAINEFLSPSLRHHDRGQLSEGGALEKLASRLYYLLAREQAPSAVSVAEIDQRRQELDDLISGFTPVLVEQLREVAVARGRYEQMFLEAYNSLSWRVNWPLRAIERVVRKGSPSSL
jgi:hypothetical protein